MNRRTKGLIVALLFLAGFWYFSDIIVKFEIGGFDIPFLGHITGYQPFAGYSQYVLPVGGLLAVLIYYMMTRRGGGKT